MNRWDKLKEHAIVQEESAKKGKGSAGNIIRHVWKDVLNKMWSIEKYEKSEEKKND